MDRILIISGPTASGKTTLAYKLAKEFNGELISADSRQVYQGMDIVTGKDVEKSKFKERFPKLAFNQLENDNLLIGYYKINGINIWGLDLVKPNQEFDVSHFIQFAKVIIADIWSRGKLPIIVGGTGFYIKGLICPYDTVGIPINKKLRQQLEQFSVAELQEKLTDLNKSRFDAMNQSDRSNPRRLIRAIEIEKFKLTNQCHSEADVKSAEESLDKQERFPMLIRQSADRLENDKPDRERSFTTAQDDPEGNYQSLWLGLQIDPEILKQRIKDRVEQRIKDGAEQEVKKLISAGYPWNLSSMSALGYKEWQGYLDGQYGFEEMKRLWALHELQYAKRQITWFKKEKDIHWFNSTVNDYLDQVRGTVRKWLKQ